MQKRNKKPTMGVVSSPSSVSSKTNYYRRKPRTTVVVVAGVGRLSPLSFLLLPVAGLLPCQLLVLISPVSVPLTDVLKTEIFFSKSCGNSGGEQWWESLYIVKGNLVIPPLCNLFFTIPFQGQFGNFISILDIFALF